MDVSQHQGGLRWTRCQWCHYGMALLLELGVEVELEVCAIISLPRGTLIKFVIVCGDYRYYRGNSSSDF